MKVVLGDILDAKYGIIGHQVNCQMVMGAGLAKQIKRKYPHVFNEYVQIMGKAQITKRLGRCQIVEAIPRELYIANLFGQFHWLNRGVVNTDYEALSMALRNLSVWKREKTPVDFPVYLPYGLGCGLAGGDWSIVSAIIEDILPEAILVKFHKEG